MDLWLLIFSWIPLHVYWTHIERKPIFESKFAFIYLKIRQVWLFSWRLWQIFSSVCFTPEVFHIERWTETWTDGHIQRAGNYRLNRFKIESAFSGSLRLCGDTIGSEMFFIASGGRKVVNASWPVSWLKYLFSCGSVISEKNHFRLI